MVNTAHFLITSSIPYVNAKPHLGFALEIIQADTLARFHRLNGETVRFLTGTDENSISNVRAAEAQGIPVRELAETNAAAFRVLKEKLDLSFDYFIRTSSDPRHAPAVHRLWRACEAAGDIYKRRYSGLYCSSCELFYRESEALDDRCPVHLTNLEVVEEENYFFRLSRYERQLAELLESESVRVQPESRRKEVFAFLSSGLEDISISRSAERAKGWGIPVPGDDTQFIYVWFDALVNYISALGYASEEQDFYDFWERGLHRIHVIGKDIVRQHVVYWPAFLLSAGLNLPSDVLIHGFLTFGGQKISKSDGTGVDLEEIVERYGIDALRYYLLAKVPTSKDSDFSLDSFDRVYRSELADQLGNLVGRTTALLLKFSNGLVPDAGIPSDAEAVVTVARSLATTVKESVESFDPRALGAIWDLVRELNRYVVQARPWEPEGDERKRGEVLYLLASKLELVASNLLPFLPGTAAEIHRRFSSRPVQGAPSLFPRLATGELVTG